MAAPTRRYMGFRTHPLIASYVVAEAEARGISYGEFISAVLAERMDRPGLAPMAERRRASNDPDQTRLDLNIDEAEGLPRTG